MDQSNTAPEPLPEGKNPALARLAGELNVPVRKLRLMIQFGRAAGELAGLNEPGAANEPRCEPFPDTEPWPEPVRAGELLARITHAIGFHVVMDRHLALVAALWAMHTHIAGQFSRTPRLVIHSGRVASGKTTLLSVLACLVFRPLMICDGTPKSLLHSLGQRPALLIDDASALLHGNRHIRALIRNGCCRDGPRLLRMSRSGGAEQVDLFTPVALALDGDVPPLLSGRALGIPLEPLRHGETAVPLDAAASENLLEMGRMIARWAQDRDEAPSGDAPPACHDPNWLPLLAVAAEIGPEWRGRVRDAMKLARGVSATSELERLLTDVRTVMDEIRAGRRARGRDGKPIADYDRIRSIDLIEQLCMLQSCRWSEHGKNGQPITPHALARILANANIRPAMLRFHTGDENGHGISFVDRGYLFTQFEQAFDRYLPLNPPPQAGQGEG